MLPNDIADEMDQLLALKYQNLDTIRAIDSSVAKLRELAQNFYYHHMASKDGRSKEYLQICIDCEDDIKLCLKNAEAIENDLLEIQKTIEKLRS